MRHKNIGEIIREGKAFKPFLKGNLRLAKILSVNPENYTVSLQWLDHPGGRTEVPILQSDWGIWCPPIPGTVVLAGQGSGDEAFIVRVHPVRYKSQVNRNRMRRLLGGEKLLQSSGGSEIYMTAGGDIRISDAFGTVWEIIRDELRSRFKSDTIDMITSAGALRLGSVRRQTIGSRSSISISKMVTADGRSVAAGGVPLGELQLKITEDEDDAAGNVDDITNPLVTVTMGTKVDSAGSRSKSQDGAEICLEIETSAGAGCMIQIDKSGNMKIQAGGKLRLDCSEVQIGSGAVRRLIDERLVSWLTTHSHAGNGLPPTQPLITNQVATSNTEAS